ncbi:Cytochrome P450 [Bradyrhizobium erythrophlei]|nr:Cytochrome P450 [Bradyrhizobium erythrophlei]
MEQQHSGSITVNVASARQFRIPPGPTESYSSAEDLFCWIIENFALYGDIYRASVVGTDVYVISAPEYCERILRLNWQNYARKGQVVKRIALLLGNGLIASNGEFWANQRRMMQPAFSKNSISGMVEMIASINNELLDKWRQAAKRHEAVNVTRDVSSMVLKITLVAIFGDDYNVVAPHFNVLAEESARNLEFARSFSPLRKIIVEVIAQRRRDNRAAATDILGKLMQARDRERGQPMPDAQLSKEVMTLVVAGHETSAGLLNWLWYLLSQHPGSRDKLSAELDRLPWPAVPTMDSLPKYAYTRKVIDEALRLYPPLWLMTRKAINDDHLGEFFVPAGTEIYISPYLIQRSPQLWEEPDDFDPDRMSPSGSYDRHELAMCPFGAGPRNCIGEQFARLEIQIHLIMFAKELVLRYDEQELPEISTGMNLLSKHDIIMHPEIRGQ